MKNTTVNREVYVIGVGMTKFEKPGKKTDVDYPELAYEAVTKALQDIGGDYTDIKAAVVGYVYGDSTCGQRALYPLGLTGIPIYNVNNNCATGSSALLLATNFILSGFADCVIALGFEKMEKGSLGLKFPDRTNPLDHHIEHMIENFGYGTAPPMPQLFGNAAREHMKKYGTRPETFAKIAEKNHKHSANNPFSQFRDVYSLKEILDSPLVFEPLTRLQCCPTSDGGAAAILASRDFVQKRGLQKKAVEILSLNMVTDLPSTFNEKSAIKLVGYDMTKTAVEEGLKQANVSITDVDVIELHDCFSANELITYEALGLCPEGQAEQFIERGDNTYGGKYVVNPSGGLISKGHPLGATGLAQCAELCWQLRNEAGPRQVPNARVALQHNIGLGGAVVLGIYKLGFLEFHRDAVKTALPNPAQVEEKNFKCYPAIQEIRSVIKKDGERLVKKLKAVFCLEVKTADAEGCWVIDVRNGSGSVKFGPSKEKVDCTISMTDSDMNDMITGKLDPQQAFMKQKLKIRGNLGVAMKLNDVIPKRPKSKL